MHLFVCTGTNNEWAETPDWAYVEVTPELISGIASKIETFNEVRKKHSNIETIEFTDYSPHYLYSPENEAFGEIYAEVSQGTYMLLDELPADVAHAGDSDFTTRGDRLVIQSYRVDGSVGEFSWRCYEKYSEAEIYTIRVPFSALTKNVKEAA